MRSTLIPFALLFVLVGALPAQDPQKPVVPCMVVRARDTRADESAAVAVFGSWAWSQRFEYVDGARLSSTKLVYTIGELKKLHTSGTHIVMLPSSYTHGELLMTQRACEVTEP